MRHHSKKFTGITLLHNLKGECASGVTQSAIDPLRLTGCNKRFDVHINQNYSVDVDQHTAGHRQTDRQTNGGQGMRIFARIIPRVWRIHGERACSRNIFPQTCGRTTSFGVFSLQLQLFARPPRGVRLHMCTRVCVCMCVCQNETFHTQCEIYIVSTTRWSRAS